MNLVLRWITTFFVATLHFFSCAYAGEFEGLAFKRIGGHIVTEDVDVSLLNASLPAIPCISTSSFNIKIPSSAASLRESLVNAAFSANDSDFAIPSSLDVVVSFVPENTAAELILQSWAYASQDNIDDAPLEAQVAVFDAQGGLVLQGSKQFLDLKLNANNAPISLTLPARAQRYSVSRKLAGMNDFFALSVLDDERGVLSYFIMDNGSFNIVVGKYNQNSGITVQDYLDVFDELTAPTKSNVTTTSILLVKKVEFSAGRKKLSFSTKGLKFASGKVLKKKVGGNIIELSVSKKGTTLTLQAKLNKKTISKLSIKKGQYKEVTVVQNVASPILKSIPESYVMQNLLGLTGLIPDSLESLYESAEDLISDESIDAKLKKKMIKKLKYRYKNKVSFMRTIKLKSGGTRSAYFSKKKVIKNKKIKRKRP